jgi:hypothetical protein
MKRSTGVRFTVALTLSALVAGTATAQQPGGTPAPSSGGGDLRWTPHRAAVATQAAGAATSPATNQVTRTPAAANPAAAVAAPTTAQTAVPATVAAAAPAMEPLANPSATAVAPQTDATAIRVAAVPRSTRPAQAPASVGLPAGVPAAVPPRGPASRQPAVPRTARLDDWQSPNRVPGPFRTSIDGGIRLPDLDQVKLFRAPQGDANRPLLAGDGGPRRPAPRRPAPADGGLAPRFDPATQRSTAARGERLAMNDLEGLSSVMARAPQAAAVEGAAPGRAPSAASPAATLPPPAATGETAPSIVIETMPSGTTEYVGADAYGSSMMPEGYFPGDADPGMLGGDGGMLMGDYPTELHVESFYDDPFACEEGEGCLPLWPHDGRICAWLRQFGRPYYGWRWYRDFTASAGVTAFENQANLGLRGNFGVNEYLNWAMPFWNAFGIGWQVGVRGVQTNFNTASVGDTSSGGRLQSGGREQVFLTTGFFTRAFEGRGLQGGAVYDYLNDNYYDQVEISQLRGELSYVWGYHELGFWGAFSGREQNGLFSPAIRTGGVASTVDLYTAFYRLHFGDANEARVWGGASGDGQGIVGASVRAPMARSWALEGTFTYLMPSKSQTVQLDPLTTVTFAPQAWNVGVNLVWYPAGRARRSLASPYRPLFDVADNGSMIRALAAQPTP